MTGKALREDTRKGNAGGKPKDRLRGRDTVHRDSVRGEPISDRVAAIRSACLTPPASHPLQEAGWLRGKDLL